jgi:hypothetical protein
MNGMGKLNTTIPLSELQAKNKLVHDIKNTKHEQSLHIIIKV